MRLFQDKFTILTVILVIAFISIYWWNIPESNISQSLSQLIFITANDSNITQTNTSNLQSLPIQHLPINPFLMDKCHDAVINNDNVNITESIYEAANKCVGFSGVLTREGLDAFTNGTCPYRHQSVRTHEKMLNYLRSFHDLYDHNQTVNTSDGKEVRFEEWYNKFPLYYMIPKSGSSTIFKILKWTNKYPKFGSIGHQNIYPSTVKGSSCSFSIVRNPIERLISGYYTINVHLWRFLGGTFTNLWNVTYERKPGTIWKYMFIKGEPKRFQTFVHELLNEPNRFTLGGGNEHIISASTMLSYWIGNNQSDIQFIGKIENFVHDMTQLMGLCSDYFHERDIDILKNDRRTHEMKGFGWGKPSSWKKEWDKYGNWVEWMSLVPILRHYEATGSDGDGILPPAYYVIDEELYRKIVNYYIQDLICFNYEDEMEYQHFKTKRDSYMNIYEMYNNSI